MCSSFGIDLQKLFDWFREITKDLVIGIVLPSILPKMAILQNNKNQHFEVEVRKM